jgi:hypothetical protein
MAKILNLDNLGAKEERQLVLGGKEYRIKEMSVEDFIESSKTAEKLENEKSVVVQMEAAIKLIKRAVPDIKEAELRALSMEQLAAVSRFVRGEDPEKIVTAGEGEQGKA